MAEKSKKGLGRGLDALFGGRENQVSHALGHGLREVAIDLLVPGKYQPRSHMDETSLSELAQSIREHGVISPILVRELKGQKYEIIAGERRYRASLLADLKTVPVLIRHIEDEHALAIALIENIQRENLTAIEEALGLDRLTSEFHLTHEEVAKAVGKSRSTVTNLLRLLALADEVKEMMLQSQLEMGHGRALLALKKGEQIQFAKEVVAKNLTVRETEQLVSKYLTKYNATSDQRVNKNQTSIDNLRLQEALADLLGATVKLNANKKGKGKLVIEFSSLDQLQGILDHIHK